MTKAELIDALAGIADDARVYLYDAERCIYYEAQTVSPLTLYKTTNCGSGYKDWWYRKSEIKESITGIVIDSRV